MSAIPPAGSQPSIRIQVTPRRGGALQVEVEPMGGKVSDTVQAVKVAPGETAVVTTEATAAKPRPRNRQMGWGSFLLLVLSGAAVGYGFQPKIDQGVGAFISWLKTETPQAGIQKREPVVVESPVQRADNQSLVTLLPPVFNMPDPMAEVASRQETDLKALAEGVNLAGALSELHYKRLFEFVKVRTVRIQPPSANGSDKTVGAGWLMSEDGLIVTNAHVVQMTGMPSVEGPVKASPAEHVTVELCPQSGQPAEVLQGKVLNVNPLLDVALVKLETSGRRFPFIPVATTPIQQGDTIVSGGHPLNFSWTLSTGRVVGLSQNPDISFPTFQTDTYIAPGSSGGPVVNTRGEFVGMNTAIYAPHKSPAYIGLCLPGEVVVKEVAKLRSEPPEPWKDRYYDQLDKQRAKQAPWQQPDPFQGGPLELLPDVRSEELGPNDPPFAPRSPQPAPAPKFGEPTPALPELRHPNPDLLPPSNRSGVQPSPKPIEEVWP